MIELRGIEVRPAPGAPPVMTGVDLVVRPGETVVLVGANGAGKTTLVRLLAGLVEPSAGSMVRAPGVSTGLVAQDPAAQLVAGTVAGDVAFGLEGAGLASASITAAVEHALGALGLARVATRAPHDLSGGEQQRVALAGALAADATLLLLDEPGSHLDAAGRAALRAVVRTLQGRGDLAIVLASQDPEDLALATRVVALREGRIALDREPRTFVAELLSAPELTRLLGIGLPAAARIARDLGRAGPQVAASTPLTMDELALALGVPG